MSKIEWAGVGMAVIGILLMVFGLGRSYERDQAKPTTVPATGFAIVSSDDHKSGERVRLFGRNGECIIFMAVGDAATALIVPRELRWCDGGEK
ncbi:MAG: hypothetical protein Q7O66_01120 [Dehalococcoidia bacterium]|nr:hypothetical protein [Dehalococcoidia bacterium]